MSIVTYSKILEGEIATAARLNAPYDALDTATLNPENTKPAWATRYHFNRSSGKFANELLFREYTGTVSYISTSTSYVTVDNSGILAELNMNTPINDDAVLRFGANGIIGEVDLNDDGGGDPLNRGYNFYAFRILMTYDVGLGNVTEVVAECGYSFSGRAVDNYETSAVSNPLWYRNFSFSGIRIVTENNFVLKKLELQAKVCPNGGALNAINVERNNLICVIAEH
jgi:hypothetical protein